MSTVSMAATAYVVYRLLERKPNSEPTTATITSVPPFKFNPTPTDAASHQLNPPKRAEAAEPNLDQRGDDEQ